MTAYTETTDASSGTDTTYSILDGDTFAGSLDFNDDTDWIEVTLVAGQSYTFTQSAANGSGIDSYLYLLDSTGAFVTDDDDSGGGQDSEITYTAATSGTYYLSAESFSEYDTGDYLVTMNSFIPDPIREYTPDEVAYQLTYEYWGGPERHHDVSPGGAIDVDITALTADGQFFATNALLAWTMVTGIDFNYVTSGADMTFDDDQSGAFAGHSRSGSIITSSYVNVSTAWIAGDEGDLNTYSFQTYMHEIGHAMGLGHAGDYNGGANYVDDGTGDNHYLNDSWQMTIMSYFSQTENTSIDASYAYTLTPMLADIIAMQNLYGVAGNLRAGDTTYGENSNAGGYYDMFATGDFTFTIIDDGGLDTIDYGTSTFAMIINLAAEGISSVGGETGNMIIARGTVIENFIGGSAADIVDGNSADNKLTGNNGKDFLSGLSGDDTLLGGGKRDKLNGGIGNDTLKGNGGKDLLKGGNGNDKMFGHNGDDKLVGGSGKDTMTGGAGADVFVFNSAGESATNSAADVIKDFEAGVDMLDLSGLTGGTLNFVGSGSFTGTANEVRVVESGGDSLVRVDVDGDGVADTKIVLEGSLGITAGDFIL